MAMFAAMPLLCLLCASAAGADGERRRPDWVSRPPAPTSGGTAYFVGVEDDASGLDQGRDAAFRDAAKQIAAYLQTTISQQFVSRRDERSSAVIDKIVSASAGRLAGARILQTYVERRFSGRWPFRRDVLSVWVLVGFSQREIDKERARLKGLHKVFQEQIDDLCGDEAQWLLLHAPQTPVVVGGFREATTKEVLAISRIIEEELGGCLTNRGVLVAAQGQRDGIVSSGAYYRAAGGALVITGFLARPDGAKLTAKSVSISDDAMGPGWLEREDVRTLEQQLDTGDGQAAIAAREKSAVDSDRDQPAPVVEGPTTNDGDYFDLFGGWAASSIASGGSAPRQALLAHAHVIKYVHFLRNQVVGIGSSLVESYSGPWKVHYQQTSPSGSQDFNESPSVISIFPLHLVIAPFRRRWLIGRTVGAPFLSYSFSAWGSLHLRQGPGSDSPPLNVMVNDVSISIPVGNWTDIQGGFLSVRQPGFTMSQDGLNPQTDKNQTTTWSVPGFRYQQWYIGAEFHFGGRL